MIDNSRTRTKPVDGIIIHSMAEEIDGQFAYDFLDEIGLSAHYLVLPSGDIIHGPDPDRVAYHAGKSKWGEQTNLNETFVGIEVLVKGNHTYGSFLEAIKDPNTFKEKQYKACAGICNGLMNNYQRITKERILRHSTVSGPEVREDPKKDPGEGFKMSKLKEMIQYE